MKILLAVHHFPPQYTGGTEWEAYRISRNLIKKGHEVFVICVEKINEKNGKTPIYKDEIYDGIPVRRISLNLVNAPNAFKLEYDNDLIGDTIHELAQEYKPDILHLFSGYLITGRAVRTARQCGIPAVITLNDFWFLCKRITLLQSNSHVSELPIDPVKCAKCLGEEKRRFRIPGRLFPDLMNIYWRNQARSISELKDRIDFQRETLNLADALIVRSRFLSDFFVNSGVNSARIHLSRQGLDSIHFQFGSQSKHPSDILRMDYIGQIAPQKGIHVLIKALSLIPNVPILVRVFGNIDPSNEYAKRIMSMAENDKRIIFSGRFGSPDKLDEIYLNNDIIVVPSIWYENSPNVILEAFARRTPVITSGIGGMAELVHHEENGLLFEMGNSQSLADQIRRLVENPKLLSDLRSGIGQIKTIDEEVDELEGLYAELV